MIVALGWTLIYGLEMSVDTLSQKTLFLRLRFTPVAFVGMAFLALAFSYVGKGALLTRRNLALLSVVPTVTMTLGLMIGYNHYFLDNVALDNSGPFPILTFEDGPGFFIQMIYNYCLMIAALLLIASSMRNKMGLYRIQAALLMLTLLLPTLFNISFQLGITPLKGFNPTSASFTIGSILLLWALHSFRLLDLKPMARNLVMEEIPDVVLVFDERDRLVDLNRAASAQLNLHGKSPLGATLGEVFHESTEFIERCRNERTFHSELSTTIGTENRTYEASVRDISPDSGPAGRVIILRDITSRKKAEALLTSSEERYRKLIELAPFPVLITGRKDGKALLINRRCQEQLRISNEKTLTSRSIDFYVNRADRDRLMASLRPQGEVRDFEIQLKTSEGKPFWAYLSASQINFEGHDAIFAAFNDVDERKRTADALRTANAKLNLLSNITRHDLLNSLTSIRGLIQLTKEEPGKEKTKDYLEKLDRYATAAEALISFTKDYQDLGVATPIWQVAADVMERATGELEMGTVRVSSELKGVEVYADGLLQKVFYNLIDNSLRHGQKVKRIELSYEKRDRNLTIILQDDGIGVPQSDKDHIFEREFGKNMGLGLFLVREILAITDISIKECGRPGAGARFEILVPEGAHRIPD
jgi:PAS domain S-box-containing protein